MKDSYALLADLIVILHLIYVLFAVGGLLAILVGRFLRWSFVKNPWFRICHLTAAAAVAIEATAGLLCPLTEWEYNLRQLAGQRVNKDISFVGRLAGYIIFYDLPSWVFTVVHISFGLLVLLTFFLIPPLFSKKK